MAAPAPKQQITYSVDQIRAALAKWGLSQLTLESDLDILEIGCGGGANVVQILKRCRDGMVTGGDYSGISVEKSK